MSSYRGRGNGASPATDVFPFSASVASSPAVLITGTTAAAQTTVHTCSAKAFDAPYIRLFNVGASAATVYGNIGSTATTGNASWVLSPGKSTVAFSYDTLMSNSGVFGFWATATSGVYAIGNVSRFYTATG